MTYSPEQIQTRAIQHLTQALGVQMGSPILYGPDNRVLAPSPIQYSKRAAGNVGSLRNWRPRQLYSEDQMLRERETIQARVSDLVGSDPHAAGVVNSFPQTVIGNGLTPHPIIDDAVLEITREQAEHIELQQRRSWARWWRYADISERLTFGEIQYLWEKCLIQYGESLTLIHMRKRPGRRYMLCLRPIHPMRMKTPRDKKRLGTIFDGIEIDKSGTPVAVWIKKSEAGQMMSDESVNFIRIEVKKGHRWQILHDFITEDPEQFRSTGGPLASCIKGFKDLSDFLNAELVSNVVTAAFAMFVELQHGQNPFQMAGNAADFYDLDKRSTASDTQTRYQELVPGAIMYGNLGERPHPISANRPGATFEPFVREIKKAFAHGLGIPYAVMFKDMDNISFAGFRSAMLEAWRVFYWRRKHIGQGPSQKVYVMLQEEAFLNNDLEIPGGADRFYTDLDAFTTTEWYGPPKGDIEPYKQAKADLLLWENNAKTLERIILETGGGNPSSVIRQIEKEKNDLAARGMLPKKSQSERDPELSGELHEGEQPAGQGEAQEEGTDNGSE